MFAYPDYWAATLFSRLTDNRVLDVEVTPAPDLSRDTHRVFARCTLSTQSEGNTTSAMFPDAIGGVTVLVLNFNATAPVTVSSFGNLSNSVRPFTCCCFACCC